MSVTAPDLMADERGTTLVELMVALMTGLIIISALTTVVMTTMHGSARVTSRVEATQRARIALTRLMQDLHSACVSPEIAPVREDSDGATLRFVHQTGSAVQPSPTLSVVSYSDGTLTQSDYPVLKGTAPHWTFDEETPSRTRTLLTDVSPIPPSSSIFNYYRYENGTIAASPQETPLEADEAALTVVVQAGLRAAPERTPVADAGASADLRNAATLRLTPPSFNEGSPSRPCS